MSLDVDMYVVGGLVNNVYSGKRITIIIYTTSTGVVISLCFLNVVMFKHLLSSSN